MSEHGSKSLPLGEAEDFLQSRGLLSTARQMGFGSAQIGSLSHTLWKAIVVNLLQREGLLDQFLQERWRMGSTADGKKKIQRYETVYRRYATDNPKETGTLLASNKALPMPTTERQVDSSSHGQTDIPQLEKTLGPRTGFMSQIDTLAETTSQATSRAPETPSDPPPPSNMQTFDDIEIDPPLEEEVESVDLSSGSRRLYTAQGDPEIESLYGKFKRGRLIVQPDFQRHFVWDAAKASHLIESALLEIPLPIIYLSEEKDGKEYVIDGQQRLTSFFSFIDGVFPDGRDFRLSNMKVFPELNKTLFSSLDEDLQMKIRYCKVRTITFKRESDPNLKFEVFERLNTGSVSLNDQELRNCIYRGPFNRLISELSRDPDFMFLLGIKRPDTRMKDVELVLRFAAFYHATYLNYRSPMKRFLNDEAEAYQFISTHAESELRSAFKNACSILRSLLGEHAFKRFYKGKESNPNGHWEPKKFNASLYDILMFSFAREDKNRVYQNLDAIREAYIHILTEDQEFIDAIELSTSSTQAITVRFDKWRSTLQSLLGIDKKEPRCFSAQLKAAMLNSDPTCSICHQAIRDLDDAALDHIKQYWTGGRTVPENARLAHRYCNWSRPRLD